MLRGGPKCGGSSPPEKVGEAAHLFCHQPEMAILFLEPRVIPAVVLIQLTAKIIWKCIAALRACPQGFYCHLCRLSLLTIPVPHEYSHTQNMVKTMPCVRKFSGSSPSLKMLIFFNEETTMKSAKMLSSSPHAGKKDFLVQIFQKFVPRNLLYLKSTSMCMLRQDSAMMPCYAGDLFLDLSLQTWYKSTECFSRLVHV